MSALRLKTPLTVHAMPSDQRLRTTTPTKVDRHRHSVNYRRRRFLHRSKMSPANADLRSSSEYVAALLAFVLSSSPLLSMLPTYYPNSDECDDARRLDCVWILRACVCIHDHRRRHPVHHLPVSVWPYRCDDYCYCVAADLDDGRCSRRVSHSTMMSATWATRHRHRSTVNDADCDCDGVDDDYDGSSDGGHDRDRDPRRDCDLVCDSSPFGCAFFPCVRASRPQFDRQPIALDCKLLVFDDAAVADDDDDVHDCAKNHRQLRLMLLLQPLRPSLQIASVRVCTI